MSDAYGRATNPERFFPLIDFAVDRLRQMEKMFEVRRSDEFVVSGLLGLQPFVSLRTPICLTPHSRDAAPIMVAFTPLPSLVVRCGHWFSEPFASCVCDACAATVEQESERLADLFDALVTGRFRERLDVPFFGQASVSHVIESAGGRRGNRRVVSPAQAREMLAGRARVADWAPWQKREPDVRNHDV